MDEIILVTERSEEGNVVELFLNPNFILAFRNTDGDGGTAIEFSNGEVLEVLEPVEEILKRVTEIETPRHQFRRRIGLNYDL